MPEQGGQFEIAPRDLLTTVRYAGASGDYNPLHYDPEAARRARFDRVLVHGAWLAAHCEYLLAPLTDYASLSVRFEKPVMIGEALQLDWVRDADGIEGILSGNDTRRVSVRLNQRPAGAARPDDYEPVLEPFRWVPEEGALRLFWEAVTDDRWTEGKFPLSFLLTSSRWSPSNTSLVRQLGFDYARLLHGTTQTELFGALPEAGESFMVSSAYANRTEKPHREGGIMRFADIISDISDDSGTLRARIANRFVERPKKVSA